MRIEVGGRRKLDLEASMLARLRKSPLYYIRKYRRLNQWR